MSLLHPREEDEELVPPAQADIPSSRQASTPTQSVSETITTSSQ